MIYDQSLEISKEKHTRKEDFFPDAIHFLCALQIAVQFQAAGLSLSCYAAGAIIALPDYDGKKQNRCGRSGKQGDIPRKRDVYLMLSMVVI